MNCFILTHTLSLLMIFYTGTYCQVVEPDTTILTTNGTFSFRYVNSKPLSDENVSHVLFDVMSCNEARVALSSSCTVYPPRYVIHVGLSDTGGFQLGSCSIFDACWRVAVNLTQYHLSCVDFKTFWIEWRNDVINVGIGSDISQNIVISEPRDNLFRFDYISIRSIGTATWRWKTHLVADSDNFHLRATCQNYGNTEDTTIKDDQTDTVITALQSTTVSATSPESTTSATSPESTISATSSESTTSATSPESTTSATSPESMTSATSPESTKSATTSPESTKSAATSPESTISVTSQESTITTFNQATYSKAMNHECFCRCQDVNDRWSYLANHNMTHSELLIHLQDYLFELKSSISIDRKNTSFYKSGKISANDKRKSSAIIGWFGAFLVSCPLLLALVIDVTTCAKYKSIDRNKSNP